MMEKKPKKPNEQALPSVRLNTDKTMHKLIFDEVERLTEVFGSKTNAIRQLLYSGAINNTGQKSVVSKVPVASEPAKEEQSEVDSDEGSELLDAFKI